MNEFQKFKEVAMKKKDLFENVTGEDCKKCPVKKLCQENKKNITLYYIKNMDESETRFPHLLKLFQKYEKIPKIIPAYVYNWLYKENLDNAMGCPYRSKSICDNIDKIEQAYNLIDEKSKRTYLNVLLLRLLTFDWEYAKAVFCCDDQYFIDDYCNLSGNEVFVDCGAYIGDTFDKYLEHNKEPKSCYMFEPDKINCEFLKQNLKSKNIKTICHVIPKGVSEKSQTLFFEYGEKDKSRILYNDNNNSNVDKIEVVSIDEEVSEPITFIKMDIEGFEQQALKGAKKHIQADTPKLAVCLYHNIKDFWEIPLMIHKMNKKYNHFVVKHYSFNTEETVLYAYADKDDEK